jgi:hypothetical protein
VKANPTLVAFSPHRVMSNAGAPELVQSLEAAGWRRIGDEIVAPHGTMWLNSQTPWHGAGMESGWELLERMRGRLSRILANRNTTDETSNRAWEDSFEDTQSLIACLETFVESNRER